MSKHRALSYKKTPSDAYANPLLLQYISISQDSNPPDLLDLSLRDSYPKSTILKACAHVGRIDALGESKCALKGSVDALLLLWLDECFGLGLLSNCSLSGDGLLNSLLLTLRLLDLGGGSWP